MSLTAELLDTAALNTIRDEWRGLAVSQGNAFLTPEWFEVWSEHYGQQSSPVIIAVRDSRGLLAGVLPLASTGRLFKFAGANVGDWFGPLARAGREVEVASAAAALASVGRLPLVLHNVDRDAPWISALMSASPHRLIRIRLHQSVIPYVPLPATWNEFIETRSRNFRNQIGRKERNLRRNHGARFRMADPDRIGAEMRRFFALHGRRWASNDGGSTLARRTAQAYHSDFAVAALHQGWLRLWFLEVAGEDVAAWYGWRVGNRYSFFNAGWEPAWSHASVGLVLLAHTIRSAIEEGADEYDFLLGNESYKSRFATVYRPVETTVLARPLDPAQIVVRAERGVRRLADRLPTGVRGRLRAAAIPLIERFPGARPR